MMHGSMKDKFINCILVLHFCIRARVPNIHTEDFPLIPLLPLGKLMDINCLSN